jgi:Zn ribbon nucleic-acid-binding protein
MELEDANTETPIIVRKHMDINTTNSTTKMCSKCNEDKLTCSFFYGYTYCKPCQYKHDKTKRMLKNSLPVLSTHKICNLCKIYKSATHFRINNRRKDRLGTVCKSCTNEDYKKITNWRNHKKREGHCGDCGYKDRFEVLCFSHLDRSTKHRSPKTGKTVGVSALRCLKKLQKEWKLVRLLCRNCHHLETARERKELLIPDDELSKSAARQRERINKNVAFINNEKLKIGECKHCKLQVSDENMVCMEWDHIEQENKIMCISNLRYKSDKNIIIAEIEKCQLLCANCHYIKSMDNDENNRSAWSEASKDKEKINDMNRRSGIVVS